MTTGQLPSSGTPEDFGERPARIEPVERVGGVVGSAALDGANPDIEPVNPYVDDVSWAVSQLTPGATLKMSRFVSMVFGQPRVDRDTFHIFQAALEAHPDLTRNDDGSFEVMEPPPSFAFEETVIVRGSFDSMLSSARHANGWNRDRKRPFSRRRLHFKRGAVMDGYNLYVEEDL